MEILIGCGGAIIKDKKVLLTKRVASKHNYPNCWTFPAGRIEESDVDLAATAAREVQEEAGLEFIPKNKLGIYETKTKSSRFIGFIYLGEWSGEAKPLKSEVSEMKWFSYEETKELDMAFSYDKAIEDLFNNGLIE
jgi:8-oxo-dGTP diphosphatase